MRPVQTIIRLLVSTAAGLEADTDTYLAVRGQQREAETVLIEEQKNISATMERKQPIGFAAAIERNNQDQG